MMILHNGIIKYYTSVLDLAYNKLLFKCNK